MATIVTRAGKGSPLTNNEVDANFVNLNTELVGKVATIASADGSVAITGTTAIDLSVAVTGSTSNVLLPVRNTTGATLTKGTAVYISGATGQISTVSKAIATSDATSAQTLGLVTANISNNSNGDVTLIGAITNIDTSAYTDGQQLYLSPTTAGTLTATKPHAPSHMVYMAVVEHAHPTQGKLFVKVQNGYEMDELHDVSAQSPTNGQTLVYNSTTDLWEKNTVSLTAGVNGTLPVANGGTGTSTLTGYIKGSGTSAFTASSTIPASDISSGAALTKTDDTNVTLTLGGSPTTALLAATSLALGWTGQLSVARGGTGAATLTGYVKGTGTTALTASASIPTSDISGGAALTEVDDTNVTLTLGGSPTTALLAATSITAGWTGQLAVGRGGTGASTLTGIVVGNGTSAFTTVTAPSGAIVGTTDIQTLTNKTVEAGTFTNGYTEEVATANTSTAYTIDLAGGSVQILTLTGNCTFTFPTATAGRSFILILKQDGTGSRTATWPATVKWPAGTAPTITSTASKADKYIFTADGTNWIGSNAGQNYTL
jgi:hypothetical protein